jgi:hypothetical protein
MDVADSAGAPPRHSEAAADPTHDADIASVDLEPGGLSAREQEVLAFERQWWKYAGAKEQAVRDLFDMSATRYYQLLNTLIDRPEALAHDPMLVKRLRRMRSERARQRSTRRLGVQG